MAFLSISEFKSVSKTNYGASAVDCLPAPSVVQTDLAIPADASAPVAAAYSSGTNFARIYASGDCRVSVANDGNFEVFPAGTVEVRQVEAGKILAVKKL